MPTIIEQGIAPIVSHLQYRLIRKKLRVTKSNLATLFGVSPTAVTYWESGRNKCPILYHVLYILMSTVPAVQAQQLQLILSQKNQYSPVEITTIFCEWIINNSQMNCYEIE